MVFLIIVLTVITSIVGFNDSRFFERGKFNTAAILEGRQFDRLLTSGFLHADFLHLLFNMMTLFFFSDIVIHFLGIGEYIGIYFGAILAGNLLSLWLYRKNPFYSAIGASGGVSGILFASIVLYPHLELYMFFIPIPIKGWVFGLLYLGYSVYGMKAQLGNIGHAAHLGGSVLGMVLVIIFSPDVLVRNGYYIALMAIPIIGLAYYVYKEKN